MQALQDEARALGTSLDAIPLVQFEVLRHELLAWNLNVNLTAIMGPEEILISASWTR